MRRGTPQNQPAADFHFQGTPAFPHAGKGAMPSRTLRPSLAGEKPSGQSKPSTLVSSGSNPSAKHIPWNHLIKKISSEPSPPWFTPSVLGVSEFSENVQNEHFGRHLADSGIPQSCLGMGFTARPWVICLTGPWTQFPILKNKREREVTAFPGIPGMLWRLMR